MKNTLLILLLKIGFIGSYSAQVEFTLTSHDFGELSLNSPRFIDIYLKNKGPKTEFRLSIKKPAEVVYIPGGATIEPDSSSVIRFQVNPKKKGLFTYKIEVYTSDKAEPTIIKLKGNLRELPKNNLTAFQDCPNFNQKPGDGNPFDFELTVLTIDEETKVPLAKSTVSLLQNGAEIGTWKTNKNGEIIKQVPLGITYFYATHEGYFPAEKAQYVNFKSNYVVLELGKKPTPIEVVEPEVPIIPEIDTNEIVITIEEPIIEEPEVIEPVLEEILLAEEITDTIPAFLPPAFSELEEDNFDSELFKETNVVFVIDVSSSMKMGAKMDLMKFSLYQLVDMLRPQDKIGLVSYATNTRVLLPPTSGDRKDEIKTIVEELKASGMTSGGAGIKLGYKQAKKNFIKGGNNKVIVITDGAFNKNDGKYEKYIKKYKRKGITLSIVGVQSNARSTEKMTDAAELGDGRYILIEKLAEAKRKLKQEIRISAYKY